MPVLVVNIILVVIEIIALIHDIYAFGSKLFEWYTIDSNVLQLVISCLIIYYVLRKTALPDYVTKLHFISAVGLTVTFLIAAFVLAPEGGIRYYFLENVALINHLIAPALSVISLLFLEKTEKSRWTIVLYPAVATLTYGLICLAMNAMSILDGPYFFLQAGKQPAGTIVIWFVIIGILCLGFSVLYYKIKWRRVP
jgi:hypothetical protein